MQIISEAVKPLGIKAEVKAVNADTWLTDIASGNFTASLHWSDAGSTPWTVYSVAMDGLHYKPIGEAATWNYGRYSNPAATEALAAYANATDDDARNAALATLEQIMVEETPIIPTTARPALAEYSVKNFVGCPRMMIPTLARTRRGSALRKSF